MKKNILENKNLAYFFAITLIFFGVFAKMEYAADTYAVFNFSARELIEQFASSGRIITAIVGAIFKVLHIKNEIMYISSFFVSILCITISQYRLYNIIKSEIKNELIGKIIPILIIVNTFSIELFLFVEKGIMTLAILMCILALENVIKLMQKFDKKIFIYAIIYMLIATCSYQGVIGIFICLSILFILKYSKTFKEFIINNIYVAFIYGMPAIIDYLFTKILYAGSRVNGEIILLESLRKIYYNTIDMAKYMYNMLPKYLFIGMNGIIMFILLYYILSDKKNVKYKVIEILKIIYIISGTIIATIMPQIMQSTSEIWFVARSTYAFASIYGILLLYLYMNYKISNLIELFVIIISIILILFNFYMFNLISTDRYKLNAIDYQVTMKISEQIDEYEKKTSNKITKIAIYNDKNISYTYSGIFATGDINIKAYCKEWIIEDIINYYCNRKIEIVEKQNDLEEYFREKDWKTFDLEQLKFEGDTLHICCY